MLSLHERSFQVHGAELSPLHALANRRETKLYYYFIIQITSNLISSSFCRHYRNSVVITVEDEIMFEDVCSKRRGNSYLIDVWRCAVRVKLSYGVARFEFVTRTRNCEFTENKLGLEPERAPSLTPGNLLCTFGSGHPKLFLKQTQKTHLNTVASS